MDFSKNGLLRWVSRFSVSGKSIFVGNGCRARLFLGLFSTMLLVLGTAATATTYVYDDAGRLVGVGNSAGEGARYRYDAMGNLTAVDRYQSTDLVILGFTPGRGAPGTPVVIQGNGFSSIADENAVTFGGVSAPVISATPQELVVHVPTAAATGPIAVTTGGRTTQSSSEFVVESNALAPVIEQVAPLIVHAADTILVTGQHFSPVAGQTAVKLGNTQVVPMSITDQALNIEIPTLASSGKIVVSTYYGASISDEDVLVLPANVGGSSIASTGRMIVDGGLQQLAVASQGQSSALLFEGNSGDWLSLQLQDMGATTVNYVIYGPSNIKVISGSISDGRPSVHLPRLGRTGTYLLLLTPVTAPASWKLRIEKDGVLANGGGSVAVDSGVSGQSKRLLFDASAGENMGIGFFDHATPSPWTAASISVYAPDGHQLQQVYCEQQYAGCGLNVAAAASGRYTMLIVPETTGNGLLAMDSALSSDVMAPLTTDVPMSPILGRRGQNGRFSFNATAGTSLALQIRGQTTIPASRQVYYRIYQPDGTLFKSIAVESSGLQVMLLPSSGTYTVLMDPAYGETATAQILLSSGLPGQMVLNDTSGSFSTTLPGDAIYFGFDVAANQNIGLGISDLNVSNGTGVTVNVYQPNGTLLIRTACNVVNDGCDVNLPGTTAGRYAVEVRPISNDQTMSLKATLSEDIVSTMLLNSSENIEIGRRGQNARVSFSGLIGDTLVMGVTNQTTTPTGMSVYYRVYAPDGALLASTIATGDKQLHMALPVSGTYMMSIDPAYGALASATVGLTSGPLGSMDLDGSVGAYATTTAGQDIALTVNAVSGKNMSLGLSDLVVNSGTKVSVKAYTPTGATYQGSTSCYVANGGCDIDFNSPVTGAYTVIITPASSSQTVSLRATLSSDLLQSMDRDVPVSLSIERPGQNASLSFSGSAGEKLALRVGGEGTNPAGNTIVYAIFRPTVSTSSWRALSVTGAGDILELVLPESGNYRVYVDPPYGALLKANVTLSTGIYSGLEMNGPPLHLATTLYGESVYLKFLAHAGQSMSINIGNITTSNNGSISLSFKDPDGSTVSIGSSSASPGVAGRKISVQNPKNGFYSLMVSPAGNAQTFQFDVLYSSDVTGVLEYDTPVNLSIVRKGQNATFAFNANAGDILALQVAGQETLPAGNSVSYYVYRSISSTSPLLFSTTSDAGISNLMTFAETGSYLLRILPEVSTNSLVNTQLTISTGRTGGTLLDGETNDYETGLPGQSVFLAVDVVAGQNVSLTLHDIVLSSGSSFFAESYGPNGDVYNGKGTCNASIGCGDDFIAATTGTYSVIVSPYNNSQAMRFKASLNSAVAGNLERNVSRHVAITHAGQNGWLTFTANAGESLVLKVQNQAMSDGAFVSYRIYKPGDLNNIWKSFTNSSSAGQLAFSPTVSGEYRLDISPRYVATGVMDVSVEDAP